MNSKEIAAQVSALKTQLAAAKINAKLDINAEAPKMFSEGKTYADVQKLATDIADAAGLLVSIPKQIESLADDNKLLNGAISSKSIKEVMLATKRTRVNISYIIEEDGTLTAEILNGTKNISITDETTKRKQGAPKLSVNGRLFSSWNEAARAYGANSGCSADAARRLIENVAGKGSIVLL